MAWITGTATDHKDLSDILLSAATGSSIDSLAVNAGGTGYVVGDIVTISGGTSTVAGQAEVLTESAGVVTSLRIANAGIYSVNPGTAAITTGGTGSGLTVDTTIDTNGWAALRDLTEIGITAIDSITAIGSGYVVSDVVTLDTSGDGDITATTEATFTVATVDGGGGVTGLTVTTAGEYTATDGGAGGVATTGGTGTGLTIDPFFAGIGTEREVILQGDGISGLEEIYVGWQVYENVGIGYYNWGLFGLTGHTAGLEIQNQPGIMPGRFDSQTPLGGGCFVPLRDNTTTYWFSVNANRLIGVMQVGSNYSNFYMGFINRFATDVEFPYPLYISGCTSDLTLQFSSSDVTTFSGLTDPISDSNADVGPGQLLRADGTWGTFKNGYSGGSGGIVRTARRDRVVYPCGEPETTANIVEDDADDWMGTTGDVDFSDIIPIVATSTNPAGVPTIVMKPTPDSGGDIRMRVPAALIETDVINAIYGELDSVFWFPAFGGLISQDRLVENSGADVYRIFQNGNRTESFSFFAIKEQ